MRTFPKATSKSVLVLATAGLLATSLAACGSSGSSASGGSSPAAASASASPVATLTNLTGTSTAVKLDPGFVSALTALKLTPGVVGTAKLTDGSVVFPITGGNATYYTPGTRTPYVESMIAHDGSGLSLAAGDKKVELTNFVIDAGTSKLMGDVSLNGQSVAKGAYLFFLDGRTLNPLQVDKSAGTAVLQGTTVKVSPDAAALLNKTFGTDAVKPYFTVGIATITLKLPSS